MATITVRLTKEQKDAIKGYAALERKSISEVVLDSVLEQIENEIDYHLALEAAKSPISLSTLADLAQECGIDYESL